jgi:2-oxoglutarate ferredoxin oxidoreductase subunit gamma
VPTHDIVVAGFGGQGVLFLGEVLARAAMREGREVTWLPAYGPEQRGGTANCTVVISNEPIGSPVVADPSVLVALNRPSLDRFDPHVRPGGLIVYDATMITRGLSRTDLTATPETQHPAEENPGCGRNIGVVEEANPMAAQEPTGELVRRLIADVARLIQLYGQTVQSHLRGLGRDISTAALMIGAALLLGVFAMGVLVATLVLVADIWLPGWLAALVVLGVMLAAMAILVLIGVRRLRRRRAAWSARVAEEVRWLRSLFPRES